MLRVIAKWAADRRKKHEDRVITQAVLLGAVFRYEKNSESFARGYTPRLWMYYARLNDDRGDGRMAVGETMYDCAKSYVYFHTAGKWFL